MCKLMIQCQYLHNLIYLNINECEFRFDNRTIGQLLNNIWSLPKLIRCYINISFDEYQYRHSVIVPSIRSTSLRHLTIKSMSYKLINLVEIFQCTPFLQYLDINLNDDCDDISYSTPIQSIVTLNIIIYDSLLTLTKLLQNLANLRRLAVKTEWIDMDGQHWEKIIVNYLTKLQVFRLYMIVSIEKNENKEERVDKLLQLFESQFWLEEHQWYVQCDWDRCQETSCCDRIDLYTLPHTFNEFYFHDSIIKTKSTCPNQSMYSLYNRVHLLHYEVVPSDNRILSQFTFHNIHKLDLYLPVDDNIWSVIPRLSHLNSLTVSISDDVHPLGEENYLQAILDRASRLYSLTFNYWSEIFHEMSLFEYSSKSIRRLDLRDNDRAYHHRHCVKLISSSLGKQCEVLSIVVKYRRSILYLLRRMPNLRALNVISQEDSWKDKNEDWPFDQDEIRENLLSTNDELIDWLKQFLPSTYTITRTTEPFWKFGSFTYCWPVRIWIG